MTLLRSAVRRAVAPIRARRSRIGDPNFIGFDKYRRSGAYHWAELESSEEYRSKIDFVACHAATSDQCLDIGCGDGAYAFAISHHVACTVGIDADPDAIRLANLRLRAKGATGVRCLQLPISRLSLETVGVDRPFDLVYSMDVIEHLPHPEELLERATAVAAPSARIIIGTPLFVGTDLVSPYHVREFTRAELLSLVETWLAVERVEILPMRRLDGVVYTEGFVAVVGRPRAADA